MVFNLGDKVEVRSDEDGFVGVWYSAHVVRVKNAVSCIVEYDQLEDDLGSPLQEKALLKNVRPVPPELRNKTWIKDDEVEAYDRDGWWAGVISRVLSKERFLVYFGVTCEEVEFPRFKLRCVLDWHEGKWSNYTQVARLKRQIGALPAGDSTVTGRKRENPETSRNRCVEKSGKKPGSARVVHSGEAQTRVEQQRDGSMVRASKLELEEDDAFGRPMRLELTAYRWLLQALVSKGPLNWQQEVLLTDVRCQLQVTNVEHVSGLKKVLSSITKQ